EFDPLVLAVVIDGNIEDSNPAGSENPVPRELLPSFQNPSNPHDVNEDGRVTALDALNVINHLSRRAELIAADLAEAIDLVASQLVDVNGDGNATALDALQVVNELARRSLPAPLLIADAEPRRVEIEDPTLDDNLIDISNHRHTQTSPVGSFPSSPTGQPPRIAVSLPPNPPATTAGPIEAVDLVLTAGIVPPPQK
ncbi:MAG: dockerin type I domain-containing protein, partial [Pirellulales bacterium]|nr:dockerin type I domain-containing protein [Pirellulales bacterium]